MSGSTGRISQSCATRALHWQKSDTNFGKSSAALHLCVFTAPLSFSCLPTYIIFFPSPLPPFFFFLSGSMSVLPSMPSCFSISSSLFCSSFLLFFVYPLNLFRLLVKPSILLLLLFYRWVFYLSPCTWCFHNVSFILKYLCSIGICTPNTIFLPLFSYLSIFQPLILLSLWFKSAPLIYLGLWALKKT